MKYIYKDEWKVCWHGLNIGTWIDMRQFDLSEKGKILEQNADRPVPVNDFETLALLIHLFYN